MVKKLNMIRVAVLFAAALFALVAGGGQAFAQFVVNSSMSVSPNNGPLGGGTALTISGTHFTDNTYGPAVTQVLVDSTSVAFTIVNNQTLTATTPAHAAGQVNVTVVFGGSFCPLGFDCWETGSFTYIAPPTISSVSPASGTTVGGTSVFISGSSFSTATSVAFGGVQATAIQVINDITIQATTPAHAAGLVDIVIVNAGGTGTGVGKYTYVLPPAPVVSSITPNTGSSVGGTAVTITGTNLSAATSVTIGGNAAVGVVVVNDTTITATTPPGVVSPAVNVVVTTPSGTSGASGNGLYTYTTPTPTVTAIGPTSGSTAGGTFVTITGSHFTGATSVTIGGTAVTSFTVSSDTAITATTGAHAAQVGVDVVVTTPAGNSGTTGNGLYTYGTPPPTVTSISPNFGPSVGGTAVTITGSAFTGTTAVTIGGIAATGVVVVDDNHITATTAAHAAGVVNVAVTTPIGTGTGVGLYTYTPPPPTVTSVSPNSGHTTGFTPITITGTRFTGVVLVTVGGTAATGVVVVNDTTITALTPAGVAGAANVIVTSPVGASTGGTGAFTYVTPPPPVAPAPTVTLVAPNNGTTLGGTSVTITGTDFTGATLVAIGGNPATNLIVVNSTTITATTPAHAAGTVDVVVVTPSGPGTGSGLYTYVTPAPTVTTISPNSGPIAGGTFVTITGTNFVTGATTVTFDGIAAVGMTVINSTTITASSPAHAAGAISVVVTTAGGSNSATFTYITPAPTVTAINPNTGPTTGGTFVTITGTNLNGATAVKFGAANAASFTVVSSTQITAVSPAGALGAVFVTVTTPGGTSAPSAASQFTYAVPADSLKLRSMQVSTTPTIAQISGQAITGAIDNAIAAGFSGNPQALTPNGSGFTYYFYADPDRQSVANTSDSGVRGFAPTADKGTGRVDDAFSALAYNNRNAAKPGPRHYAPEREWLAWIDVRGYSTESHATGNDLKGLQTNVIAGLTRRLTPDFLVGILGGYEYFNYTSDAVSGRLTGSGWTGGAYLGWRFAPNLRFDAAVAGSAMNFDASAGTASGSFTGARYLASVGVTGNYLWQGFVLEPSARVYALWETESAYTDSLGTAQAERNFTTGRASSGAKVSYPFAVTATTTIAPYAGLYGDYYISRDDASSTGLTSTPLLQGWSARVISGVVMRFIHGEQLSVGGEFGGLGSNTTVLGLKVRGSVPF
jgi:hypothetical protein